MDSAPRHLAERRLIAALRRLHRRDSLRADVRVDAVIAELRADPGERLPTRHRGGGSLVEVSDADLLSIVNGLVEAGQLVRSGHRVRLPGHEPAIGDPQMRRRVERLLIGLREAGAEPPRVEAVAARLGIPAGVVAHLRSAGELVRVGEGIDYPRSVLEELDARLEAIAQHGPLTVTRVRAGLRTSRRHAEALIGHRRAQGARHRRPAR